MPPEQSVISVCCLLPLLSARVTADRFPCLQEIGPPFLYSDLEFPRSRRAALLKTLLRIGVSAEVLLLLGDSWTEVSESGGGKLEATLEEEKLLLVLFWIRSRYSKRGVRLSADL